MDIVRCEIVERISKTTGNPYRAIELTFANGMKELFIPGKNYPRIGLLMDFPNP